MVKDIYDDVKRKLNQNIDDPKHREILELVGKRQNEITGYTRILHERQGFNFNPNHIIDDFKAYTFIPHSTSGNVFKLYDCKDNAISEYNVIREISMQTYAHDVLAEQAGVNVPAILSFSKSPEKLVDASSRRAIYIIEMEKVRCDNLKEFIYNHIDSVEQMNTPGIFDPICEKVNHAIDVFESKRFFHNDLHHENILVCGTLANPDIYIIDFGNAAAQVSLIGGRDFRLNPDKLIHLVKGKFTSKPPELQRAVSFNSLQSNASSKSKSRTRSRSRSTFRELIKKMVQTKKKKKRGVKITKHRQHFYRFRRTQRRN
jgi:serine/threonine protein kinase